MTHQIIVQKFKNWKEKYSPFIESTHGFLVSYFERANVHGFAYLALKHLIIVEKLFWLILVIAVFSVTISLSLKSLERYENSNTVVTIEKDHYTWNTTLPSMTICSIVNRINRDLFDKYCENNGIVGQAKEEFYEFIESLANATYGSFEFIKEYESVDKLNIKPEDYMMLIFNLTLDLIRDGEGDLRINAVREKREIRCEQILTEHGICYNCNSYLAQNLSAMYLLSGVQPKALKTKIGHDVVSGNLFDKDQYYTMNGFPDDIAIYIHSPFETINIVKSKYFTDQSFRFVCTSIEVLADENFQRDTSISQRHCRFNSEANLAHYPIYTRGLCLQECRLELVYTSCGCIPHFYPNRISWPKPVCSYRVLKECVAKNQDDFVELRLGKTEKVDCKCLQNCVDSDVFLVDKTTEENTHDLFASKGATMNVIEYPTVRYKRKILFSIIDFYVSIGGTASFFTGVCVLGIVEISRKIEPDESAENMPEILFIQHAVDERSSSIDVGEPSVSSSKINRFTYSSPV